MDSPVSVTSGGLAVGDLGKKNVIIGRPGTGKTTTLSNLINGYIAEGNRPSGIAYLTYSRSMANQAKQRFGLDPKSGAMVGTFHSIGSKFLGWHASRRGDDENNDFLTERMIEEFCGKFGIQKFASSSFRTDYDDPEGTDEFSQIVSAYDMARNRMDGSSATDYFDSKKFDTDYLVEQLEKLKEQSGKHDYTDILVASLDVDFSPIDFLIIDEAQDLTPLMWAIVRRIRQYASKVVLAGDDMQSIYSFRGASPIDFLLQRKDAKVFHLSKSYRLPSEVKNFSDQISSRVAITEDVKFESNGKKGAVYQWSLEDFLALRGEKWILCRTGFVAEKVNRLLIMYDIPFLPLNIRHLWFSPWTREDISLVNALHAWPNLNARQVEEVIKLLPGNVLIRGVKTRVKNGETSKLMEEYSRGLYGSFDASHLFKEFPSLDDVMRSLELKTLKKDLIAPHIEHGLKEEDIVRLDTIHAAKGLEGKHVAIVTDLTSRAIANLAANPSEEHRVFYTGVTRASESASLISLGIGRGAYAV